MIKSRQLNQTAAKEAILDFMNNNQRFPVTKVARELDFVNFVRFLAVRLLKRAENEDCYFIDMLEDLERME